ncbi:MAG: CDGSH iron-sulfur domain-containing protein [Capsulimonas sp.]|jgi:CDGSH-type Zn-finger protein|uniref:CDGSH iron-sulfur domain-containing protein n=1 Tax=Capsulimonas sp. TaxID=2494211 RepID=UPI00326371DB
MAEVTIEVLKNGPLWVEPATAIALVDHDGNPIAIPEGRKGVALCRCGASVNKPFCDGTHSKIGFNAAEAAVAAEG